MREEPWCLVLYKSVPGAFEGSTEEDHSNIVTVSKDVRGSICKALQVPEASAESDNLAVDLVDGDGAGEEDADPSRGGSAPNLLPTLMPEERDQDENAEPDSDEEDYPELNNTFTPNGQQLRDLKIAHDNSGHPSNADFARLLRRGNAKQ